MTFEPGEQHKLLEQTVLNFARSEIAPLVEEMETRGALPPRVFRQLGTMGLLGISISSAYGGAGMDLLAGVLVTQALARVSGSLALSYGAHANFCVENLFRNGNEEQKQRYLPRLCEGSMVGALGITEPEAGSDAMSLSTTAVRVGDTFVLNGTKMFITNAPIADLFIIYAKTSPERRAHGISAFLVEKTFPGISVPRTLDKFGNRASPTGKVVLSDCQVPVANLLGREDAGVEVMMNGIDRERIFLAGEPLGLAEEALALSISYAKRRRQFGQPIAHFELIQAKLADMYTQLEAARALVYRTAALADRNQPIHKDAAACILFAAEMATRVCLDAMQVHGGIGYLNDLPIGRLVRDAKLFEIGPGTSEIRRLVVGRELVSE